VDPVGLFNNPIVLMLIDLICRYVPKVRTFIPNRLTPFLNTVIAWLSAIVAPLSAHAMAGPLAVAPLTADAAGGGFWGAVISFGSGAISASWSAAQAYLLRRAFFKETESEVGWVKPKADSKP